jgi:hypothetical protein
VSSFLGAYSERLGGNLVGRGLRHQPVAPDARSGRLMERERQ